MEPELVVQEIAGQRVAELEGDGVVMSSVQDAVDVVGNAAFQEVSGVIVRARQLPPEFFQLSSRLAGEVLQKFINYRVRLAVVGDFENVESESLRAFMCESNQGRHVAFLPDREAALAWLAQG